MTRSGFDQLMNKMFWKQLLDGFDLADSLLGIECISTLRHYSDYFVLDADTSDRIRAICKQKDLPLYIVLLSILSLSIYTLSDSEDIVLFSPQLRYGSGDRLMKQDIPIRININPKETLKSLVNRVQQTLKEVYANQELSVQESIQADSIVKSIRENNQFILCSMDSLHEQGTTIGDIANIAFSVVREGIAVSMRDLVLPIHDDLNITDIFVALAKNIWQVPDQMIEACVLALKSKSVQNNHGDQEDTFQGKDELQEYSQTIHDIWLSVLKPAAKIEYDDNFFECGGHSINAIQVIAKINYTYKTNLHISEIFIHKTIHDLARLVAAAVHTTESHKEYKSNGSTVPATFEQKAIFFEYMKDEQATCYNIPAIIRINGPLDLQRVQYSINKVAQANAILRTTFTISGDDIVQQIHDQCLIEVQLIQVKESGSIQQLMRSFVKPFDLSELPLFRIAVVEGDGQWWLLLDIHHILVDGHSVQILFESFISAYDGLEESVGQAEPCIQYDEYALWQQDYLQSEEFKKTRQFWMQQLEGELIPAFLSGCNKTGLKAHNASDKVYLRLTYELYAQALAVAKKSEATLFMVMVAFLAAYVHKCTGTSDVLFGLPVSGRTAPRFHDVMGMFVRTMPLRIKINENMTFSDLLADTRNNVIKLLDNQDVPMVALSDELNTASMNGTFHYNMLVTSQNNTGIRHQSKHFTMELFEFDESMAKTDMIWDLYEMEQSMELSVEYNMDMYDKETVMVHLNQYQNLLENGLLDMSRILSEVTFLGQKEQSKINDHYSKWSKNIMMDFAE